MVATMDSSLVHIERIDLRELAASGDPFLYLFVPDSAEETALGRHVRDLLAVGLWRRLCIVPERDDGRSDVFDLYGIATERGRPA